MKKIIATACMSILLYGCGTTKQNNDLAINTPIVTSIDLVNVQEDKVLVTINPGRFIQDTITYRLPKVVQGTYAISNFGSFIENFKALDYTGKEIVVTKIDTNSWQIQNAQQLDVIQYFVNDTYDIEQTSQKTPFSPSGTNIEPDNFVLNLHGFIGYFDKLKTNQYSLNVHRPSTVLKTSALPLTSSILKDDNTMVDTYMANRYFEITDNPMMYGALDVEEFKVGDIKIVLSVYSPNNVHTAKAIKETVFKMMKAQKAYLGDIDSTPRYDIYLYLSSGSDTAPTGFGALEHHTSTVVVLPEQMPNEALASAMIDVVSHEFFHIVTPLSVHSEDVHYFDYNNPTFSKHLWMYEGVTEYFATLFQVQQGLVSESEFYEKILDKMTSSKSFNDTMSFTVMSENILENPYAANYINVYQKGALIGMCIDILMREASNGDRGILSLMKELSNKYGKEKPFKDDDLLTEISKMTYPSIETFLNDHVQGTTAINYETFLEKVGLTIFSSKVETNYIQNAGALIVAGDTDKDAIYFNELVVDNSFWADNGVLPNDLIVSVNDEPLTLQNANMVLRGSLQWQEGDPIKVVLNRGGEEVVVETKLVKSYTQGKKITLNKNGTEKQHALRNAWLKG
ncbi:peptidase M61 [Aquimarina sp. W85]|uniref:M61 family metallopeptidase n=1 Tax=Aquimarina rhodophyticola TaxID=3342246 RepID=UPI00366ADE5D